VSSGAGRSTATAPDDSGALVGEISPWLKVVGIGSASGRFAVGLRNAPSPWRNIPGEFNGRVGLGAIHPALPQEAPAGTPVRPATAIVMPRSCKDHAVDNPTMPAPTTITDRCPPSIRSTSTISHLHS
jgi:hypothetical protein